MFRTLRTLGLAAAMALPALLPAQNTSRTLSVGASGGVSVPMGDLADATNAGYHLAGHVFLAPSALQSLRFRGDVAYDKWGVKDSYGDAEFRSLSFVANAIYDVKSNSGIQPYLIGGVGMFNTKTIVDLGSVSGSTEGTTDPGVQVGAGLTFKLSGFDTFAEAKFINVFADGGSGRWVPITFGFRF